MPKGFNKESAKWVDGIKEKEGYDGKKREQVEGKERRGRGRKRRKTRKKSSLVSGQDRKR